MVSFVNIVNIAGAARTKHAVRNNQVLFVYKSRVVMS